MEETLMGWAEQAPVVAMALLALSALLTGKVLTRAHHAEVVIEKDAQITAWRQQALEGTKQSEAILRAAEQALAVAQALMKGVGP